MNDTQNWLIKVNKSPVILLFKLLFSTILLDIVAGIILIIDYVDMVSNWHSGFSTEEYFFLSVLILQLFLIILIFIKWLYKYYIFENNKLTYFSWIIFKKKQEFILDKIWSTSFEQGVLWKIFNYGDIIVYIQNEKFVLKWLGNPNEFIWLLWRFKVTTD